MFMSDFILFSGLLLPYLRPRCLRFGCRQLLVRFCRDRVAERRLDSSEARFRRRFRFSLPEHPPDVEGHKERSREKPKL